MRKSDLLAGLVGSPYIRLANTQIAYTDLDGYNTSKKTSIISELMLWEKLDISKEKIKILITDSELVNSSDNKTYEKSKNSTGMIECVTIHKKQADDFFTKYHNKKIDIAFFQDTTKRMVFIYDLVCICNVKLETQNSAIMILNYTSKSNLEVIKNTWNIHELQLINNTGIVETIQAEYSAGNINMIGKIVMPGTDASCNYIDILYSGFVYSTTNELPTLDDNIIENSRVTRGYYQDNLLVSAYTNYYIRAYITDINGTNYGNVITVRAFEVSYLQDIDDLRDTLDADFVLLNNLDFDDDNSYDQTDPDWQTKKTAWQERGWTPIVDFAGTLNGNGCTIKNYRSNSYGNNGAIFYTITSTAKIINIGLVDVDIDKQSNIYVSALVTVNYGLVENCYSTGRVLTNQNSAGGLLAFNYGIVRRCYNSVDVSGYVGVGGIAIQNDGTIENCYNTGTMIGLFNIGGIAGSNSVGTIANCYSNGLVTPVGGQNGGLIGYGAGTVIHSYYDTETSGQSDTGKGEPKTTAEMKQQATFVDWDFTNIWNIVEGVTYPYLR